MTTEQVNAELLAALEIAYQMVDDWQHTLERKGARVEAVKALCIKAMEAARLHKLPRESFVDGCAPCDFTHV